MHFPRFVVVGSAQDLGFLGRELLVGQHALLVELAELLELLDRVGRRCRGSGRGSGVGRLRLLVLLGILLAPTPGLAARHAVADAVAVPATAAVRTIPRSSSGESVPPGQSVASSAATIA